MNLVYPSGDVMSCSSESVKKSSSVTSLCVYGGSCGGGRWREAMKFCTMVGPLWTVSRGSSMPDVSSFTLGEDMPPCSKSDVLVSSRSDVVKTPADV